MEPPSSASSTQQSRIFGTWNPETKSERERTRVAVRSQTILELLPIPAFFTAFFFRHDIVLEVRFTSQHFLPSSSFLTTLSTACARCRTSIPTVSHWVMFSAFFSTVMPIPRDRVHVYLLSYVLMPCFLRLDIIESLDICVLSVACAGQLYSTPVRSENFRLKLIVSLRWYYLELVR